MIRQVPGILAYNDSQINKLYSSAGVWANMACKYQYNLPMTGTRAITLHLWWLRGYSSGAEGIIDEALISLSPPGKETL